jgi:hypothetical protein
MAIWEQFPFTNFHEQNLDWVLNSVKNLDERVDTLENSGAVSKTYVDVQDAAEKTARITNDQILQNQITAHTTSISQLSNHVNSAEKNIGVKGDVPNFNSLWSAVGNYSATQSIGSKLLQVQTNEQLNSRSIAGTGGTYDLAKGTIQSRLNTIEGALQSGGLVKQNGVYVLQIPAGSPKGTRIPPTATVEPFDFAVANLETSTSTASGDGNSFALLAEPVITTPQKYTTFAVEALCDGTATTSSMSIRVRTFVFVAGTSGDQYATVSYVDDKTSQLTTELGNVEADAQEAYTKAETAETSANAANTAANKAQSDSSAALAQIGSKSASVSFANLWATIGAWAESVPMTQRINPAYNWSWNNRSAINGTADYPTDKAPINARLLELEESTARQKIMSGSATVTVASGKETVIDYASAGFTAVPQVLVTYSTTGGNPTPNGIIKVFDKTATGCKITISSGSSGEFYPIDWIATGK